jgi:hypothetical protein
MVFNRFVNWMYGADLLEYYVPPNSKVNVQAMVPNGEWSLISSTANMTEIVVTEGNKTIRVPSVSQN